MRTYTIGKAEPKPDIPFEINDQQFAARGHLPWLLQRNMLALVASEEYTSALNLAVRDDDEVPAKGKKPEVESSWRRLVKMLADETLGIDDAFVAGLAQDLAGELTGRPTQPPSDSPSGQSAEADGSEAGS